MAYFFLRYRLEHENEPIAMVSYDKDSVMEQVVLWENGEFKKQREDVTVMQQLLANLREDPSVIRLIDGPPSAAPIVNRFVVFTSPNERWLDKLDKERAHSQLYMSLWDVEELQDAMSTLKLKIEHPLEIGAFPRDPGRHNQELVYRYDVFGGVARSCIICDDEADF